MRLLLQNALAVITMSDRNDVVPGGSVVVDGNRIVTAGPAEAAAPGPYDRVLDVAGCVVMPGMVNTHHHLYQTMTRNLAGAQDVGLFHWLKFHYPIWGKLTPDTVRAGALVGLGELLLTGCTASTDHFYLFPRGQPKDLLDFEIEAARELGIRFYPTRGSMSLGESQGGLPPDWIVQSEDEILADCLRVVEAHHDPAPDSMCQVALAPCSPFSVTQDLMVQSARLAREKRLRLHTHLAETLDEEAFCQAHFGVRPVALMDKLEWLEPHTWFAHCVHLSGAEVEQFRSRGVGIAHCPTSNMRLGSGIAPIPDLLSRGVKIGLGVDGSASNDSSDMLGEARNALLAHRSKGDPRAITAREVLRVATRGGARVLDQPDLGELGPGKLADLAVFDLSGIAYAGATHDPLAALVFAGHEHRARFVMVNGRLVVEEGRLARVDEDEVARLGRKESQALLARAGLA